VHGLTSFFSFTHQQSVTAYKSALLGAGLVIINTGGVLARRFSQCKHERPRLMLALLCGKLASPN
jgi:hypothetical protein